MNENVDLWDLPSKNPDCEAFLALFNQVLDGELSAEVLRQDPHPLICPECRPLPSLVKAFPNSNSRTPIVVPSSLTDKITAQARKDFQQRRQLRRFTQITSVALAACLLLSVGAFYLSGRNPARNAPFAGANAAPTASVAAVEPKTQANPRVEIATAEPQPQVTESLAQASQAIVSLSRRTAGESLSPALVLFQSPGNETPKPEVASMKPESPVQVLSEVPTVLKSGFEPVTETPLRAWNLLVRDLQSVAGTSKSKS